MSTAARIFHAAVVASAFVGIGVAAALGELSGTRWVALAVLTAGVTLSYLRPIVTERAGVVRTSDLFIAAAAILLPPQLAVAAVVVPFLFGAFRERGAVQDSFNFGNLTLTTLGGWCVYHLLDGRLPLADGPRFLAAGAALAFAIPLLNRGLLAVMVRLAEGARLADVLSGGRVWLVAVGMSSVGVATAELWQVAPWAVPFTVAPVLLSFQALSVPHLVEEAATDSKTRLYNAARFTQAVEQEIAGAARARGNVAAVLVDLDFLREINNTHGHLAGDAVIVAVADVIRRNVRASDVAARFGGEEFAILLPGTAREAALQIAERIRRGVAELAISSGQGAPLHATVSVGVAAFPVDADDARSLVHAADVALYRAKGAGRNLVVAAA